MKRLKTILTVAAVAVAGVFGLVACDKEAARESPFPRADVQKSSTWEAADEVFDETDGGITSRAAAATIANGIYQVLVVTAQYSTTGTNTSASLAVTDGTITTATLSGTQVSSAAGFKKFSVKSEKFDTYLKRKVDKTQAQTYYMLDRDAKTYKLLGTVAANGTAFTFLPTYLKSGITLSPGSLVSANLN